MKRDFKLGKTNFACGLGVPWFPSLEKGILSWAGAVGSQLSFTQDLHGLHLAKLCSSQAPMPLGYPLPMAH